MDDLVYKYVPLTNKMDITFQSDFSAFVRHFPFLTIDGNEDTFFWTDSEQRLGKQFCLVFDEIKFLTCVNAKTGKKDNNADYLRSGIIQSSTSDITQEICTFQEGTCRVRFTDAPLLTNKLCIVTKEESKAWLIIREIELGFLLDGLDEQCPTLPK